MPDNDESLGDQPTYQGGSQRRDQGSESLGEQPTFAGESTGDDSPIDDGMEVVNLSARYTVEGPLGKGGMGEVLLATDLRLGRKVAIKRMLGDAANSRTAVSRFISEARAIARLDHDNIVDVYDSGRTAEGPFLVMQYIDGGSLLDRCREGALLVEEAVDLTCQICDALTMCHDAGVIHRDIKPANILMTSDGSPRLTDFGLVKEDSIDRSQTAADAVLGTLDFMPPEQRRGSAEVDARSDLWSLAASLYQLVTGKSPRVIKFTDVPQSLHKVLGKALEDEQDDRYQTTREFRDALRACLTDSGAPGTAPAAELNAGECPQCHTRNEASRKFCRECASSLRMECLACAEEMPAWDKICGECGGKQVELLKERRRSIDTKHEPQTRADEAIARARLLMAEKSYAEAVHILEAIKPEKFCDQALLEMCRASRDKATQETERILTRAASPDTPHDDQIAAEFEAAIQAIYTVGHTRYFLQSVSTGQRQHWETQALAGDPNAQWLWADWLVEERGDDESCVLANRFLNDAWKSGLVRAGITLSHLHKRGLAGDSDQYEAYHLLREAAATGDPAALCAQAGALFRGRGVDSNPIRAVRLLEDATVSDFLPAKAAFASLLEDGKHIESDQHRAFKLQQEAAVAGNRSAQQELGRMLRDGVGCTSDRSRAIEWLSQSACQGNGQACSMLSELGCEDLRRKAIAPAAIGLVLIEPGNFRMGSENWAMASEHWRDEAPEHPVNILKPFWMGSTPVTRSQYREIMGKAASWYRGMLQIKRGEHPVEAVTWVEAVGFCNALSRSESRSMYYSLDGDSLIVTGGTGYRLPTEAEWELACRAGRGTSWSWGNDPNAGVEFAHCRPFVEGSSSARTGRRKPNDYGLFDMHGNVWEWCQDWYATDWYHHAPAINPAGPESGTQRVVRGGAHHNSVNDCRTSSRDGYKPGQKNPDTGFRVVRNLDPLVENWLPPALQNPKQ